MKRKFFSLRGVFLFCAALVLTLCLAPSGRAVSAKEIDSEQPEIKLNVKSKAMTPDSTFTLRVYNTLDGQKVSYKSDDPKIASISDKGVITANKVGETQMTVTVKRGLIQVASLTCDITVGPEAVSVVFSRPEVTLEEGERMTLKTVIKPKTSAEEAMFSSSDPDIVRVTSSGKITAKATGKAVIYALIGNGKYDKCIVTVVERSEKEGVHDAPVEPVKSKDAKK